MKTINSRIQKAVILLIAGFLIQFPVSAMPFVSVSHNGTLSWFYIEPLNSEMVSTSIKESVSGHGIDQSLWCSLPVLFSMMIILYFSYQMIRQVILDRNVTE